MDQCKKDVNSSALAMELSLSCTNPSICIFFVLQSGVVYAQETPLYSMNM